MAMPVDDFIAACRHAALGPSPLADIRVAMEELLLDPVALQSRFPTQPAGAPVSGISDPIFEDETLSIMVVHTPPAVEQPPHDHLMSVLIGGFKGVETQRLYRRTPHAQQPIELTGSDQVSTGDIFTLGPQGIHAINAVGPGWAAAMHVYLGQLATAERSVFHPDTLAEEPLTIAAYDSYCRPGPAS